MKGGKVKRGAEDIGWEMIKKNCVYSVCVCLCMRMLTHGSPGAACVRAVALQVQADVGSSQ